MTHRVIKLENIKKQLTENKSLNIRLLEAHQFQKIAILGDNGSGKTTLLNLINRDLSPDKGEIDIQENIKYFKQTELYDFKDPNLIDGEIFSHLNIPNNTFNLLSGGEKVKIKIVDIFSNYSPILLLDEPTNHLDKKSTNYLIQLFKNYYGTLIFTSHNRKIIDTIADTIWHIQGDGSVREFSGNYSQYKEQLLIENIEKENKNANIIQERERLLKSIEAKKEQAQKVNSISKKQKQKNIKPNRLSSSKQKDTVEKSIKKQEKNIKHRISNLPNIDDSNKTLAINFLGKKIDHVYNKFPLLGQDITIKYNDTILFENLNFQIPFGKTLAIIGDNGSGKTSLLNYIYFKKRGIDCSPKIKMKMYRQLEYQDLPDIHLLKFVMEYCDCNESFARAVLNNLNLNESLQRSCLNLSGGERTKLSLAILFASDANFLLLDEPTNFLDITTIESLEEFIKNFQGTIVLSSHDQYFIDAVSDIKWKITKSSLKEV